MTIKSSTSEDIIRTVSPKKTEEETLSEISLRPRSLGEYV